MSVELVETIKQQLSRLSVQERNEIERFMAEQKKLDRIPATSPQATADRELRRQQQMAWLKANAGQFGGQYVALVGDQLIAVGRTFRAASEAARAAQRNDAFVTYLPKPDEVLEIGGWV